MCANVAYRQISLGKLKICNVEGCNTDGVTTWHVAFVVGPLDSSSVWY